MSFYRVLLFFAALASATTAYGADPDSLAETRSRWNLELFYGGLAFAHPDEVIESEDNVLGLGIGFGEPAFFELSASYFLSRTFVSRIGVMRSEITFGIHPTLGSLDSSSDEVARLGHGQFWAVNFAQSVHNMADFYRPGSKTIWGVSIGAMIGVDHLFDVTPEAEGQQEYLVQDVSASPGFMAGLTVDAVLKLGYSNGLLLVARVTYMGGGADIQIETDPASRLPSLEVPFDPAAMFSIGLAWRLPR